MTVSKFFDTYFPGEEFAEMRDFVRHWVEGYDAGDMERISVQALRADMNKSARWDQHTLKETYAEILTATTWSRR